MSINSCKMNIEDKKKVISEKLDINRMVTKKRI